MQANVKTNNSKNLKVKALVDFGCTHTGINKQLVKEKRIQMKPINFSFELFNADETKNKEMTKVAPLEIEINEHKETLEAAVIDLDGMDIFLGYDLSRLKKMDLIYFIFLFIFYFIFDLFFYFLFLGQLGLEVIGHTITSVI